jgi:hypothetical protein
VQREEHAIGLRLGDLLLEEGNEGLLADLGGVHDLTSFKGEFGEEDFLSAVLAGELDFDRIDMDAAIDFSRFN